MDTLASRRKSQAKQKLEEHDDQAIERTEELADVSLSLSELKQMIK